MNKFKIDLPCPVVISEAAKNEINYIFNAKNIPKEYGLRVGVNGGGCSGVSYFIGFDLQKEADQVYTSFQVPLLIEKKHAMFLWGVTVDFVDTAEERGFVFNK